MEKYPLRNAEDDSDRKLLSDVARVGWHLVGITEGPKRPSYVFSVGLYHSFDQPEIIIIGLDTNVGGQLINSIGDQMQAGKTFRDQDIVNDIADGLPLALRVVTEEYYQSYLGYALWFYESMDFPVLQCVWPDKGARFPWDRDCDEGCRIVQHLAIPGG